MAARKTTKSAAKKTPAKKTVAKKPVAKKPVAKKPVAKKPVAKKPVAKKPVAKKPVAKKPVAKKPVAKKSPAKKPAARKLAAKKPAAKKAPVKKLQAKTATKKTPAPRAAKTASKPSVEKKAAPAPEAATPAPAPAPQNDAAPKKAAPVPAPAPGPAPAVEHAPEQMITTADGGHHVAPPAPNEAEPEIPADMPQPGSAAPEFALPGDDDQLVRLSALRGRKVVLYFYPRDNTPGCTIEAQDFSSLLPEFEAKNAVVLGVSADTTDSHRKFKHTCDLSVKLLADTTRSAHDAYGTWREKNMYGKQVMGTQRSTFLIGEDGRIAKVWPKVKVENHALDVLNAIK